MSYQFDLVLGTVGKPLVLFNRDSLKYCSYAEAVILGPDTQSMSVLIQKLGNDGRLRRKVM